MAISPSAIAFAGAGSAPQTFTITSSVSGAQGPTINTAACAPVVTFSGGSTTLPTTYTVSPVAIGSCSIVVTVGTKSAAIGITVGTPPNNPGAISGSGSGLTLTLGGGTGTYTVNVTGGTGPGTLTFDATSCNGIAGISGSGGPPPQTFTATALAAGTCAVTVYDGSQSFAVPITVNAAPSGTGLFITPSAVSLSSRDAQPQPFTITFQGNVGQVSFDQSSCNKPRIAYFVLDAGTGPVLLPATGKIYGYGSKTGGSGSCTIVFTPQNGASATLAVSVSP
ncbi:MAG: hypothetical protein NVS3B7_06420 [Candidatus Elarobacter sp.]